METIELKAAVRADTGKKGAKKCRKDGLLPGVLYGRGAEPIPVTVKPKELDHVLHTGAGSNVIIQLTVEQKHDDPVNVVVKELQVEPIRGTIRHVDFCQISLDEKIRTAIPFKIIGEAPGVKQGGILEHTLWEMEIESLPLDIPDCIEVDVSELEIGDSLAIRDLQAPETVTVLTDWDVSVVHVAAPRVEEVVEVAPEAELEGVEPEVISAEAEKEAEETEQGQEPKATEEK